MHEKSRDPVETRVLAVIAPGHDHLARPGVQQAITLERNTVRQNLKTRTVQ